MTVILIEDYIKSWLLNHRLSSEYVDCATAVMLKILDGKCKMPVDEKQVMTLLYEQVKEQPGQLLQQDIHELITVARANLDEPMKLMIYEKRVLAETMISRPVMKTFKAMLRQQGLFAYRPQHQEAEL